MVILSKPTFDTPSQDVVGHLQCALTVLLPFAQLLVAFVTKLSKLLGLGKELFGRNRYSFLRCEKSGGNNFV